MHDVRVCKYMFVCEHGGQQVASRVPFLGSTLCKKSSWTPVECPKLFRMALVGHTLCSGPTLLNSHQHPLPLYCRREG